MFVQAMLVADGQREPSASVNREAARVSSPGDQATMEQILDH